MILDKIVEAKKAKLPKNSYSLDMKKFDDLSIYNNASFYNNIAKSGLSIIGEIKKASPSKGIIKEDFIPTDLAKQYGNYVDAISVLTEEDYFKGSINYLRDVHGVTTLPLLRKDFIIDPIEIYEAKENYASAVLLIVAILDKPVLKEYIKLTKQLGMDALVEVHDENELITAVSCDADIIGINNRNLNTFEVNLETTINLANKIPKDILVISESGIDTKEDIIYLKQSRIDAILVGESFMRSNDIAKKAKEFKDAFGN